MVSAYSMCTHIMIIPYPISRQAKRTWNLEARQCTDSQELRISLVQATVQLSAAKFKLKREPVERLLSHYALALA